MIIVSGTGHRPSKLVGHETAIQLRTFDYLYELKPDEVISGMADGFDTYLALAALELDLPLTCAIPFRGHRSKVSQDVYDFIVAHAKRVVYVCDEPYKGPWQFQTRNEWMVDSSTRLASCWDGTRGGTYNCIRYAVKVGRQIDVVWGSDPSAQDS